ncbi:MAG: PDZ domain-containing protein [Hyphomicrobium sp.]|uniref:S1C family serine protease n=1 Tax=Hyphomicrobium sp. TaxID=82 RepID=UPI0025C20521|nr:PDZ domain-containing protein [Hyphomicrobium sp.]MBZ0210026.1 PDZ domain-containing protein [Hyphomicrobium sp.]
MAPPPAPIAPQSPSEGDKPSERAAPDVRAGPETEAQATPPPFNVPGLPADHPLNEALRNSPGLQNHPLFELFKNLPPPQGQETARAPQPESAAPNPRSNAARGWLGVKLQEVDADMASALSLPAPQGAMVAEVVAGGPASEKLSPADVILEINGQSVRNVADASARLGSRVPGEVVRLRVLRNGDRMLFAVRVGSWTDPLNSAK